MSVSCEPQNLCKTQIQYDRNIGKDLTQDLLSIDLLSCINQNLNDPAFSPEPNEGFSTVNFPEDNILQAHGDQETSLLPRGDFKFEASTKGSHANVDHKSDSVTVVCNATELQKPCSLNQNSVPNLNGGQFRYSNETESFPNNLADIQASFERLQSITTCMPEDSSLSRGQTARELPTLPMLSPSPSLTNEPNPSPLSLGDPSPDNVNVNGFDIDGWSSPCFTICGNVAQPMKAFDRVLSPPLTFEERQYLSRLYDENFGEISSNPDSHNENNTMGAHPLNAQFGFSPPLSPVENNQAAAKDDDLVYGQDMGKIQHRQVWEASVSPDQRIPSLSRLESRVQRIEPPTGQSFIVQNLKAQAMANRNANHKHHPRACKVPPDVMASFIDGPHDGKFYCLYQNCGRAFSRKYNISLHIQTHLYDRPYQCPVCKAGFVRGHDLSRHVLIHGGNEAKSHCCPCGKRFVRGDALSRHRQRGICIGAIPKTGGMQSKKTFKSNSYPLAHQHNILPLDSCFTSRINLNSTSTKLSGGSYRAPLASPSFQQQRGCFTSYEAVINQRKYPQRRQQVARLVK